MPLETQIMLALLQELLMTLSATRVCESTQGGGHEDVVLVVLHSSGQEKGC